MTICAITSEYVAREFRASVRVFPIDARHDAPFIINIPLFRTVDPSRLELDAPPPGYKEHPPPSVAGSPLPDLSIGELEFLTRWGQLVSDNNILRSDLLRATDRLNIVLDMSRRSESFQTPDELKADLLARYAVTLSADVLYLDDGQICRQVSADRVSSPDYTVAPENMRMALATEIAAVRHDRRTIVPGEVPFNQHGLPPAKILLSPLDVGAPAPEVVIALRIPSRADFDKDDCLASETILVYGGHLLRNALILRHLKQSSLETVGALANAIEARDQYTGGHSERVGRLAVLTGKALELTPDELQLLEWSGLLHDVGKIGIPEHILNKPGALTPDEFELIKRHPRLGYDVLRPISNLESVLEAVLYHHENWDGSGYPRGLRGEQIPRAARILHVVDIFDALTSTRSYRRRLDFESALKMLAEGAGRETDPHITSVFIKTLKSNAHAEYSHYVDA